MTGPDLTRTIAGGTHGFATAALLVGVYDNASLRNAISVGWTVNPSTYDVAITFASPQSNYYVVIIGGVGAVSNRRNCIINNDSQSAIALTAAKITGRCEIPFAAHIVEVGVWGGTGTGTQTYTGGSSVQLTRLRPSDGTTATVLTAALATPNSGASSNKACARATTSGTCINGLTSSGSVTLAEGATVAVNAGDVLYVSAATADGVQTWYTVTIVYTVD
jgi:hypothetical protein